MGSLGIPYSGPTSLVLVGLLLPLSGIGVLFYVVRRRLMSSTGSITPIAKAHDLLTVLKEQDDGALVNLVHLVNPDIPFNTVPNHGLVTPQRLLCEELDIKDSTVDNLRTRKTLPVTMQELLGRETPLKVSGKMAASRFDVTGRAPFYKVLTPLESLWIIFSLGVITDSIRAQMLDTLVEEGEGEDKSVIPLGISQEVEAIPIEGEGGTCVSIRLTDKSFYWSGDGVEIRGSVRGSLEIHIQDISQGATTTQG